MSKPSASLLPAMYSHRIHDIQVIARACGYCIAVHGSMQCDLDLVAIPWTNKATTAKTLIKRLCDEFGLVFDPSKNPTEKPHGRLAWSLVSMGAGFLDLSIMPKARSQRSRR